jgi:hypothetical protein
MAENKKPVKVIKAGDMSPETKALPDETRLTPKGIGKSEKDMGPLPTKEDADKQRDAMEKALLQGAAMGGMGQAMQGMKKGGKVSSASKRADGIAIRGKTKA